jgi:hypothetical protein
MQRTIVASAREAAVPPPIASRYLPTLALLHYLVSFFKIQRFVILLFVRPNAEVVTGRVSSHRWRASPSMKGKALPVQIDRLGQGHSQSEAPEQGGHGGYSQSATGRGRGAVQAPGQWAYSSAAQRVWVVLDHSWHPAVGPLAWGDAICSHPLFWAGYVAFCALGGGVFNHSVSAGMSVCWSSLGECCGGDGCQVHGASRAVLTPQDF